MSSVNSSFRPTATRPSRAVSGDASSLAILWNIGINYIQGYFLQEPSNAIVLKSSRMLSTD